MVVFYQKIISRVKNVLVVYLETMCRITHLVVSLKYTIHYYTTFRGPYVDRISNN